MANNATRDTQHASTPEKLVPRLLAWFTANARDLPWRRTRDPYAVWVSEIMLQQTQVKTVIPYWNRWMRELPTLESLAKAKPGKIHKLWEGLGYYTRVRNMQKAAQQVCSEHRGEFPQNFEVILALPGIGRYTAGAIASIAFNQPKPVLDGNVIRVLTRLHGITTDPQEKETNARLWRLAEDLVTHAKTATNKSASRPLLPLRADNRCSFLNQSLMELGALICTPRSPNCAACPVAQHCFARREDRIEDFPRPKPRAITTPRRFIAMAVEQDGKFLVRQRPDGVVNAHLWEFPNIEADVNAAAAAIVEKKFSAKPASLGKLCTVKHSITRYRYSTEAYRISFKGASGLQFGADATWRTLAQLDKLPFTSAHRRILSLLHKP